MVHIRKGKTRVTTKKGEGGHVPHIPMNKLVFQTVPQLIMIINEFKRRWMLEKGQKYTYKKNAEKSRAYYRFRLAEKQKKLKKTQYQVFMLRKNELYWQRVKSELKQEIARIKKMKKKQFSAVYDSSLEQTKRSPKLIRTIAWARIIHRTNIIVRQSGFTRTEMIALLWMYKREYVTSNMFVHEMNEHAPLFRLWMLRMRKKGWVNVEKRKGIRTKIYYLTPIGTEMADKIITFVKKNPSKKRK